MVNLAIKIVTISGGHTYCFYYGCDNSDQWTSGIDDDRIIKMLRESNAPMRRQGYDTVTMVTMCAQGYVVTVIAVSCAVRGESVSAHLFVPYAADVKGGDLDRIVTELQAQITSKYGYERNILEAIVKKPYPSQRYQVVSPVVTSDDIGVIKHGELQRYIGANVYNAVFWKYKHVLFLNKKVWPNVPDDLTPVVIAVGKLCTLTLAAGCVHYEVKVSGQSINGTKMFAPFNSTLDVEFVPAQGEPVHSIVNVNSQSVTVPCPKPEGIVSDTASTIKADQVGGEHDNIESTASKGAKKNSILKRILKLFGNHDKDTDYDKDTNHDNVESVDPKEEIKEGVDVKKQLELNYDRVIPFGDKYYQIKKDDKYGLASVDGKIIRKPKYSYLFPIDDEVKLIKVKLNDKIGFLNLNGEEVCEPKYDYVNGVDSKRGLMKVKLNDKLGFLNLKGQEVCEPKFDYIYSVDSKSGLMKVKLSSKLGFLNLEGKEVCEPQFDYVYDVDHKSGLIKVEINRKYGFFNPYTLKVVAPCRYTFISSLNTDGLYEVKIGDKIGYLNKDGSVCIEPK